MLQTVLKSGTGKGLGIDGISCAGKTGTTNDNKDGWFVGYSYYYTTAVWVGYDTPKKLPGLSGASYPGKIWHNFMTLIHDGLSNIKFKDYINYNIETETVPGIVEEYDDSDSEDNTSGAGSSSSGTSSSGSSGSSSNSDSSSSDGSSSKSRDSANDSEEDEGEEDVINSESEEVINDDET